MALNLLPQASEADIKKTDSGLRGFIGIILWIGILIFIFVVVFSIRSFEGGIVTQLESEKAVAINKIQGLGKLQDDYYTLAYKTSVLDQVKTKQYKPSIIGNYVDSKINGKATVSDYRFDASGNVSLQLQTKSYLDAARLWNDLLSDKKILTELNLSSFSQDAKSNVTFELKGKLNLEELYARDTK